MARGDQRKIVRCAIYTRKSTEEGLDQEFNSLDAQYEACAAYVSSQRHEGWTLVKERYDDGGLSGGNMDRPGLQRLLADIEARRVDTIVVYKVDRLTRALSDFAKIVEVLDSRGASFVSITQAFNTTTSMGRLTLNVLLSFAQFEREVISERVRDKVAASRKKGIWMGGSPPLGYDVADRKLVVNPAEAEAVRHIMRRYVELGCGRLLLRELREAGIRTKVRPDRGGVPFSRGSLFYLLSNRSYLGESRHHNAWYPGEHEPIVDQRLWHDVQATITTNRVVETRRDVGAFKSLLAGLIFDAAGRRMVPSHANKLGRRYRYYVTAPDQITDINPACRMPAHDVEQAVRERLSSFLTSKAELRREFAIHDAATISRTAAAGATLTEALGSRHRLQEMITRVDVNDGSVLITLNRAALSSSLGLSPSDTDAPIILTASAVRVRHGKEVRLLLQEPGEENQSRNPHLLALLREAAEAKVLIDPSAELSISEIASREGRCRSYLAKLYRIAHLAPELVQLIMTGRQPAHLTTRMLLNTQLPLAWSEQAAALRIA
jgi:site-specific DNA recombinase